MSCLCQLQNNLVTKLAVQQAEGGVGKWIAGALKLILLIDVWTWPEGLTSGANCKLDFFFFSSSTDCGAVSPVCHLSTTISKGIIWYTDIMNSMTVSVLHLLGPVEVVDGVTALRQRGEWRQKRRPVWDVSDRWHGQGNGLEENAASSSQLARHRFNLVHSPDLTALQRDWKA